MARESSTREVDDSLNLRGMVSSTAAVYIVEIRDELGQVLSASGTAKRNSTDKGHYEVGSSLAIARALENLARKLKREVREYL